MLTTKRKGMWLFGFYGAAVMFAISTALEDYNGMTSFLAAMLVLAGLKPQTGED